MSRLLTTIFDIALVSMCLFLAVLLYYDVKEFRNGR